MADGTRKSVTVEWANANPAGVKEPSIGRQNSGYGQVIPPVQEHNYLFQLMTNMLQNAEQNGIMEWRSTTSYKLGGLTLASNGAICQSLVDANQGNDPATDVSGNWIAIVDKFKTDTQYVALTGGTHALSINNDSTAYTYNIADFTGFQLNTGEIRELFIRIEKDGRKTLSQFTYTLPDGSTETVSLGVYGSGDDDSLRYRNVIRVPVNKGQVSITLQCLQGLSAETMTLIGATQRI